MFNIFRLAGKQEMFHCDKDKISADKNCTLKISFKGSKTRTAFLKTHKCRLKRTIFSLVSLLPSHRK